MNAIANSFISIVAMSFVRRTGYVMKDRLPIQAATKGKKTNEQLEEEKSNLHNLCRVTRVVWQNST